MYVPKFGEERYNSDNKKGIGGVQRRWTVCNWGGGGVRCDLRLYKRWEVTQNQHQVSRSEKKIVVGGVSMLLLKRGTTRLLKWCVIGL